MTRRYSLVIEHGPDGLSAYVPELPSILVTGDSMEAVERRAAEAIQIYWQEAGIPDAATATVREIEVELPA